MWCQVTSTCKQLWGMQVPGSASEWELNQSVSSEGESKAN